MKSLDEYNQACRERDLYRKLLALGEVDDPQLFLRDALDLFVAAAGARRGYIELRGARPSQVYELERNQPAESHFMGEFSRSVVEEAFRTGQIIMTASALQDPRFQDKASVQGGRIEAVLCAPIGHARPLGVVYLQGRPEARPFSERDREHAELFARHLASFADRVLLKAERLEVSDPTARFRRTLELDSIVGSSPALAQVFERVAALAPFDQVAVLLTGPSGTGKTQLARVIHQNSKRAHRPFVEVSCANLPEALLENELFGAAKGGHATASSAVVGKVESAEGGSLFLDEIGELPLTAQAKLLQLLQSHSYFPLGSAKARTADVRVIAATNRDLGAAVRAGSFREDLFYRINTFPIRLPALAERTSDIPELSRALCRTFCERHGMPTVRLSLSALHTLESTTWVGNIRELAGVVERAIILARSHGLLEIGPEYLSDRPSESAERAAVTPVSFSAQVERYKRELVLRALEESGWNVAHAARSLELARAHVYNLMQMHGIERPARTVSTEL